MIEIPKYSKYKPYGVEKDNIEIKLNVQINYELTSLIFSYGEKVKVIEPQTLADEIKKKAQQLLKNYL